MVPKKLLNAIDKMSKIAQQSHDHINYHTGFDHRQIAVLNGFGLKEYIESLIGKYKIGTAHVLDSKKPYSIHCDIDSAPNKPYKAVLVPLEDANTHTIIFNEYVDDNTSRSELPVINSLTKLDIDNYLSHCENNYLDRVSIQSINRWCKGVPIVWDLKQLHASDNFLKNNIDSKRAFVMFTEEADE